MRVGEFDYYEGSGDCSAAAGGEEGGGGFDGDVETGFEGLNRREEEGVVFCCWPLVLGVRGIKICIALAFGIFVFTAGFGQ